MLFPHIVQVGHYTCFWISSLIMVVTYSSDMETGINVVLSFCIFWGWWASSFLLQTRNARWCGMMMCSGSFLNPCREWPTLKDNISTYLRAQCQLYLHFQVFMMLLNDERHMFFVSILDASPTWIPPEDEGPELPHGGWPPLGAPEDGALKMEGFSLLWAVVLTWRIGSDV